MPYNGTYEPVRMHILIDIDKSCTNLYSHQVYEGVYVNTLINVAHYWTVTSLPTSSRFAFSWLWMKLSTFSYMHWRYYWLTFLLNSFSFSYRHVGAHEESRKSALCLLLPDYFLFYFCHHMSVLSFIQIIHLLLYGFWVDWVKKKNRFRFRPINRYPWKM